MINKQKTKATTFMMENIVSLLIRVHQNYDPKSDALLI